MPERERHCVHVVILVQPGQDVPFRIHVVRSVGVVDPFRRLAGVVNLS
jgi:hypothetical protein